MTDTDRKQQVLQAEAAILQLAEQLALTRQSRAAADEVAGNLQAAQAALERTQAALQETLHAFQEHTQRSSAALAEARNHLNTAQRQVSQACNELHGISQLRQDVLAVRRLLWAVLWLSLLGFGTALTSLVCLVLRLV